MSNSPIEEAIKDLKSIDFFKSLHEPRPVTTHEELREEILRPFSDREVGLIENARQYATGNPSGLPAHNLMIIIDKQWNLINSLALLLIENTPEKDGKLGEDQAGHGLPPSLLEKD